MKHEDFMKNVRSQTFGINSPKDEEEDQPPPDSDDDEFEDRIDRAAELMLDVMSDGIQAFEKKIYSRLLEIKRSDVDGIFNEVLNMVMYEITDISERWSYDVQEYLHDKFRNDISIQRLVDKGINEDTL